MYVEYVWKEWQSSSVNQRSGLLFKRNEASRDEPNALREASFV